MNTPNDSKRGIVKASLLFALALTSCGGGGSSAPVPREAPQQIATILFQQAGTRAVLVTDPGDESWIPRDVPHVSTFDMGPVTITDDERGIGIRNDSRGAPSANPIKTANLSWMPSQAISPWSTGDASVCTSFTASVPESQMWKALGNYAGVDLWFKAPSGRTLIITGWFFDDGRALPDTPAYDAPWINAVQVSGPIGRSARFTTTAGMQHTTQWSDPQQFGICVNREQVARAFAIAGIAADLSQVTLKQVLISNETNIGSGQSLLKTYFSGWTVTLEGARP